MAVRRPGLKRGDRVTIRGEVVLLLEDAAAIKVPGWTQARLTLPLGLLPKGVEEGSPVDLPGSVTRLWGDRLGSTPLVSVAIDGYSHSKLTVAETSLQKT
jgi:hypothetical protein